MAGKGCFETGIIPFKSNSMDTGNFAFYLWIHIEILPDILSCWNAKRLLDGSEA